MPYSNLWECRGVCTRFSGFVSAAEYVLSAQEICADPRFDDLRFVIKDLLAIDDHSIDRDAIEPIAAIRYGARYTNPNIYVILLTTDPRLAPLTRPDASSFLRGLYETCAFADEAAARRWLATQPPLTRLGAASRP
ncbi:MAG: hypothetical protein ACJ8GJ_13690 [Vitreoscilla sp.]